MDSFLNRFYNKSKHNHFKNPFNFNGFTYINTDRILVRIKEIEKYPSISESLIPGIEKIFETDGNEVFEKLTGFEQIKRNKCIECGGSGYVYRKECDECDGSGELVFFTEKNSYEVECQSCKRGRCDYRKKGKK